MERVTKVRTEERVASWVRENTKGFDICLDLGAGLFNMTEQSSALHTIGVEACLDQIIHTEHGDSIEKIHGDMTKLDELDLPEYDLVMMIDTIEHLEKEDGLDLLNELTRKDHVNRILVFTPLGFMPHDYDGWGYDNVYYETHRSGWEVEDLEALGFECVVNPTFHKKEIGGPADQGAIFAIWDRF